MCEIEIPIIIGKNLATYKLTLLLEAIMHMDVWNPRIGEILKYRRELTNEVDRHAVAIMRSNLLGKESVVGHIL